MRRESGAPTIKPSSSTVPKGKPVRYSTRYCTEVLRLTNCRRAGSKRLGSGTQPQVWNRLVVSQGYGPGACGPNMGLCMLYCTAALDRADDRVYPANHSNLAAKVWRRDRSTALYVSRRAFDN